MFPTWAQLSSKIMISYAVLAMHIMNEFGLGKKEGKKRIRNHCDKYRESKERGHQNKTQYNQHTLKVK